MPVSTSGLFEKLRSYMRHASAPLSLVQGVLPQKGNYKNKAGDLIDASVVMAPVQWIQRAIPEARFRTIQRTAEGVEEIVNHELTQLVMRPNPHFTYSQMMAATVLSRILAGNAYWLKVRNVSGKVVELWWIAPWHIEPRWPIDGSEFISHYLYTPGTGTSIEIPVEDVIHFRDGVNPGNPRLGLSCLNGVYREIFTDLEASNFVAALLDNMAVPGIVISPDGSANPSDADARAVKEWFKSAFGGSKRGEPLVMQGATKVQQYGFSPQQMDLSPTRNVAEERVCAAIGIPAAVVGFGSGLQSTKVGATMTELRKLAWTNGILPILRDTRDELNRSLVPEFEKKSRARANGNKASVIEADHDTGEVKALQDDLNTEATRWNTMVQGGWATIADAKEGMGLDVQESDRIYLRQFSVVEVPEGLSMDSVLASGDAPDEANGVGKSASKTSKNRRRRPAAGQRRYVEALVKMERRQSALMEKRLQGFFKRLSNEAGKAVRDEDLIGFGKGALQGGGKSGAESSDARGEVKTDAVLVGRILERMGLAKFTAEYKALYEAHYLEVGKEVARAGELAGLSAKLPDPVAQAIVQAGGKRAELVGIDKQSRKAIFDALAEGRAEGEGVEQLADRIAENVSGGPWQTAKTRATIIARTETKYAQNVSTIEVGREAGAGQMMIFDGRLGPDRSDPDHIARDGSIVTIEEASQMASDEHPNGTLSFAPHFE